MIKTVTIEKGLGSERQIKKFEDTCYNLTDYAHSRALIEQQIDKRYNSIIEEAKKASELEEPREYAYEVKAVKKKAKAKKKTLKAKPIEPDEIIMPGENKAVADPKADKEKSLDEQMNDVWGDL